MYFHYLLLLTRMMSWAPPSGQLRLVCLMPANHGFYISETLKPGPTHGLCICSNFFCKTCGPSWFAVTGMSWKLQVTFVSCQCNHVFPRINWINHRICHSIATNVNVMTSTIEFNELNSTDFFIIRRNKHSADIAPSPYVPCTTSYHSSEVRCSHGAFRFEYRLISIDESFSQQHDPVRST